LLLDDTRNPRRCQLPELGDTRWVLVGVEVRSQLLPGRNVQQAELGLEVPGIASEVAEHCPVSGPRYLEVFLGQLRVRLDLDSLRLQPLDQVRQTCVTQRTEHAGAVPIYSERGNGDHGDRTTLLGRRRRRSESWAQNEHGNSE